MNLSSSTVRPLARSFAFLAGAALVTVGCGGGGSGATPSPAAATATGDTGGNGAASGTTTPTPTPAPAPTMPPGTSHAQHKRCGWIGADTFADGKASFLANPDYFDDILPKWGTLNTDGSIRVLSMADDPDIMSTAKAHGVRVIPLVDSDDPSYIRTAMASPAAIAAHAAAVTNFAVQHGYDGVELDYEHLWTAADRAPYVALITAVAASLHAQGKLLTLALPAEDHDDGNSAYDYTQIQDAADVLHLMAYDYHYLGGDHLGPLSPKGWVSDVVTRVNSLGEPGKYTLGLANYGIGNGWYTSAKDAASRCGGPYLSQTDHMTVCPYGHQEAGLAPHCTTSQGDVWFEDTASMSEKATLAKNAGFGGVGYWTVGDEPDGFFSAMQGLFSASN